MTRRVKTTKKQDLMKILEVAELSEVKGGNVACASTSEPPPDPPIYV